ncbi:MAG: sigma-70 family RNA polymerase sigma factor [Myxococcota bacterium]
MSALVEHMFRQEHGRLMATLVRILGPARWEVAEDIVQDTLLAALTRWSRDGVPDNPAAWLTQVAKRRAIDAIRHQAVQKRHAPELASAWHMRAMSQQLDAHFEREVVDDQLHMMFLCCVPTLTPRAQVMLMLKTLCGFSVQELAHSLLSTPSSVERALGRARRRARAYGVPELEGPRELQARLSAVRCAIYVLFNEGYHGAHPEHSTREELCVEALRLGGLLEEHPDTQDSSTHALLSLMFLHAARLPTRVGPDGARRTLERQDRTAWDPASIALGFEHLRRSAVGDTLSSFHLEAAIAAHHARAPTFADTDWGAICALYDQLVLLEDTPITHLNRAIAQLYHLGPEGALRTLHAVQGLDQYPFLPAARALCYAHQGDMRAAAQAYDQARALARNEEERVFFAQKVQESRDAMSGSRS